MLGLDFRVFQEVNLLLIFVIAVYFLVSMVTLFYLILPVSKGVGVVRRTMIYEAEEEGKPFHFKVNPLVIALNSISSLL